MNLDYAKIKEAAKNYEKDMTKFLRDIVKFPGESCDEKAHIDRIAEEMTKLGFDKVDIDPMGNVLGYMGTGETLIGFDAHIDTVGIGNKNNWNFDPYEGYENDTEIGGRGVSDQCGGIVSAVYGAKIMKDLGMLSDKYTVLVTGTVQEEDCDGLCWQYIINEDKVRPDFVVSTEPTDGGIYRGQRGRMEIRVDVKGVSCHGSAPERGDNAIYKMADILQDVRALNENDAADDKEVKGLVKMLDEKYNPEYKEANFLGRGTVTVSEIFFTSPSRCAVADSCSVSLDRRMTAGETWESCLDEIRALPAVKKYGDDVTVSMYEYSRPSYKGLTYPIECYFPTWVIPEDHKVTKSLEEAYKNLFGDERIGVDATAEMRKARPLTDKWTFSTNGVSIMGRNGIPCIGFGPGAEAQAHAPNELRPFNPFIIERTAKMAKVRINNSVDTHRQTGGTKFYMPTEKFKPLCTAPHVVNFSFNVKPEQEMAMEEFLTSYTENIEPGMDYESKQTYVNSFHDLTSLIITIGAALSVIIGLIGITNFINSMLTSIITRKKEFAMLQSIGMTGKQLKSMLACEGLYYAIGTILASAFFGTLFSLIIVQGIANSIWFFTYRFVIWPMLVIYPFLLALTIIIPSILYRKIAKTSIIERLRTSA